MVIKSAAVESLQQTIYQIDDNCIDRNIVFITRCTDK